MKKLLSRICSLVAVAGAMTGIAIAGNAIANSTSEPAKAPLKAPGDVVLDCDFYNDNSLTSKWTASLSNNSWCYVSSSSFGVEFDISNKQVSIDYLYNQGKLTFDTDKTYNIIVSFNGYVGSVDVNFLTSINNFTWNEAFTSSKSISVTNTRTEHTFEFTPTQSSVYFKIRLSNFGAASYLYLNSIKIVEAGSENPDPVEPDPIEDETVIETLPWNPTAADFDQFTVVGNSGYATWTVEGESFVVDQPNEAKDDWLISPAIKLEGDKSYTLKFVGDGVDSYEDFEVYFAKDKSVSAFNDDNRILKERIGSSDDNVEYSVDINVEANGNYYLAWHACAPWGLGKLVINSISLNEKAEVAVQVELPWTSNFKGDLTEKGIKVVDANKDGNTWGFNVADSSMKVRSYNAYSYQLDDWLFTPGFNFEAGKTYVIEYTAWGEVYSNKYDTMEVKIGQGANVGAMTETLLTEQQINHPVSSKGEYTHKFKCTESGVYNLGFHATSYDIAYISVLDIHVYEYDPFKDLPWAADFKNSWDEFTAIDANGDGKTWYNANGVATILYPSAAPHNDWLITPGLRMEAGKKYLVSYEVCRNGNATELLNVSYGTENTVAGMKNMLTTQPISVDNTSYAQKSNIITCDESGVYYIGFQACTTADNGWSLGLQNLKVEEYVVEYDLSLNVDAPSTVLPGEDYTIRATVANAGAKDAENVWVYLKTSTDGINFVYSENSNVTVNANGEHNVDFSLNMPKLQLKPIYYEVSIYHYDSGTDFESPVFEVAPYFNPASSAAKNVSIEEYDCVVTITWEHDAIVVESDGGEETVAYAAARLVAEDGETEADELVGFRVYRKYNGESEIETPVEDENEAEIAALADDEDLNDGEYHAVADENSLDNTATSYTETVPAGKKFGYYVAAVYKDGDGNVYESAPSAPLELVATAISAIVADFDNFEAVYTFDGVRVARENLAPGLYIVVKNGKAQRVLVK